MSNISHTKILSYQSNWPEKFQAEKEMLAKVFGAKALEIEHIGSTSIPGLASKAIIDIAVMIKSHDEAETFTVDLEKIGYKLDSTSPERHFYTKGDPIEYHLSIAYADRGGFWPRQILFRDYLREHSKLRDEYAKLKTNLLEKDSSGYGEYISGKSDFVNRVLNLAGWKESRKYGS